MGGTGSSEVPREAAMSHRVFVYGSLLPSLHNHDLFLSTSTLLGPAATATADYLLVDSCNNFPYALDNVQELAFLRLTADQEFWNESTVKLVGMLYEVSDETLARLDMLEGHPNFYRRKKISLADGSDAIAYLLHDESTRKSIALDT